MWHWVSYSDVAMVHSDAGESCVGGAAQCSAILRPDTARTPPVTRKQGKQLWRRYHGTLLAGEGGVLTLLPDNLQA